MLYYTCRWDNLAADYCWSPSYPVSVNSLVWSHLVQKAEEMLKISFAEPYGKVCWPICIYFNENSVSKSHNIFSWHDPAHEREGISLKQCLPSEDSWQTSDEIFSLQWVSLRDLAELDPVSGSRLPVGPDIIDRLQGGSPWGDHDQETMLSSRTGCGFLCSFTSKLSLCCTTARSRLLIPGDVTLPGLCCRLVTTCIPVAGSFQLTLSRLLPPFCHTWHL